MLAGSRWVNYNPPPPPKHTTIERQLQNISGPPSDQRRRKTGYLAQGLKLNDHHEWWGWKRTIQPCTATDHCTNNRNNKIAIMMSTLCYTCAVLCFLVHISKITSRKERRHRVVVSTSTFAGSMKLTNYSLITFEVPSG